MTDKSLNLQNKKNHLDHWSLELFIWYFLFTKSPFKHQQIIKKFVASFDNLYDDCLLCMYMFAARLLPWLATEVCEYG